MTKVYSITVLEKFICENVNVCAFTDLVTTNFSKVEERIEELKESYHKEYFDGTDYEWNEISSDTDNTSAFELYDEEGDGVELLIAEHEI